MMPTIDPASPRRRTVLLSLAACGLATALADAQFPTGAQITKDGTSVLIEDYASVPPSSLVRDGVYPAPLNNSGQMARVNALVSEPSDAPAAAGRFFVIDQNGVLYTLDKMTKAFTPYIDVGRVFGKFTNSGSLGAGVASIAFDPAYATNGRFYTAHTENPNASGTAAPTTTRLPGVNVSGYAVTPAINPPTGGVSTESVLVEWVDTDIRNATFEGTAREILRVGMSFRLHPMGDILFSPLASRGDLDYGNLYIAMGDGTAGERAGVTHTIPQRLDALTGKILRITPDISLRPNDRLAANGRYRIPSDGPNANPFVDLSGARGEIYAYGFRNPHRLSWDVPTGTLLANDVGHRSWEEVNIIDKGGNYGWAEREGPEQVFVGGPNDSKTGSQVQPPVPFPSPDVLTVDRLETPVTPVSPAATYSHRDGTAIGSGFVYRGRLMPPLTGKYLFSEIVSGRIFYADFEELRAAHRTSGKLAIIHELQIVYKDPSDASAAVPVRVFDLVAQTFLQKHGVPPADGSLPAGATGVRRGQLDPYGVAYGGGRADVRFARGADDEIYILSKSDGMIRKMTAVVSANAR